MRATARPATATRVRLDTPPDCPGSGDAERVARAVEADEPEQPAVGVDDRDAVQAGRPDDLEDPRGPVLGAERRRGGIHEPGERRAVVGAVEPVTADRAQIAVP